jgi:hypothetical protein
VRKILVLSLAGALVLTGAVVAVARLGGEKPEEQKEATPSPAGSTEPSPGQVDPTPGLPGVVPPPEPPSPPAAPPAPGPPAPPAPAPAIPDPPGYRPAMVKPRAGMDNVHRVTWRRAEVLNDRTVRIHYESGVEPCSVLDRVEVEYRVSEIAVSLFEGSDPAFKDAVCIMIAQFKAVDVPLDQPVNGRTIVDGNQ